jgi:hypothetical protein
LRVRPPLVGGFLLCGRVRGLFPFGPRSHLVALGSGPCGSRRLRSVGCRVVRSRPELYKISNMFCTIAQARLRGPCRATKPLFCTIPGRRRWAVPFVRRGLPPPRSGFGSGSRFLSPPVSGPRRVPRAFPRIFACRARPLRAASRFGLLGYTLERFSFLGRHKAAIFAGDHVAVPRGLSRQ